MNPKMSQLRKKAMALPLLPGVYIMHDKSGKIIYIGKAKALKNRVSQYFGSQNNHAEKVLYFYLGSLHFSYPPLQFNSFNGLNVLNLALNF